MKRLLLATAALLALGSVAIAQTAGGPGSRMGSGAGMSQGMGPGAGMARGQGMGQGMGPAAMALQLDTDGDGAISAAEMAAHRQAMFALADADGNGILTADEFTNARPIFDAPQGNTWRDTRRQTMQARNFALYDTDANGLVTAEEWTTQESRSPMLQALDTNGDGAISADEMAAASRGRGPGMRWQ